MLIAPTDSGNLKEGQVACWLPVYEIPASEAV